MLLLEPLKFYHLLWKIVSADNYETFVIGFGNQLVKYDDNWPNSCCLKSMIYWNPSWVIAWTLLFFHTPTNYVIFSSIFHKDNWNHWFICNAKYCFLCKKSFLGNLKLWKKQRKSFICKFPSIDHYIGNLEDSLNMSK